MGRGVASVGRPSETVVGAGTLRVPSGSIPSTPVAVAVSAESPARSLSRAATASGAGDGSATIIQPLAGRDLLEHISSELVRKERVGRRIALEHVRKAPVMILRRGCDGQKTQNSVLQGFGSESRDEVVTHLTQSHGLSHGPLIQSSLGLHPLSEGAECVGAFDSALHQAVFNLRGRAALVVVVVVLALLVGIRDLEAELRPWGRGPETLLELGDEPSL
jgi:hypothetical protein